MHWDVIQLRRGMKTLAAVTSYILDKFETWEVSKASNKMPCICSSADRNVRSGQIHRDGQSISFRD